MSGAVSVSQAWLGKAEVRHSCAAHCLLLFDSLLATASAVGCRTSNPLLYVVVVVDDDSEAAALSLLWLMSCNLASDKTSRAFLSRISATTSGVTR